MIIGGFAKNSLIDFPGKIACIVFTQGCNFKCPYCHNPGLVAGPFTGSEKGSGPFYEEAFVMDFLARRKGLLEGVVITGGEPTLQPDLIGFCRRVKAMGYHIKLDTNGTRPGVLDALFNDHLLDYLAMDIKAPLEEYDKLWKASPDTARISQSVELIMARAKDYEFRTTCVKPFVTQASMKAIGQLIKGAKTYILQQCSQKADVLEPEFLEKEDRFYSRQELETLQKTAEPYVKNMSIR